MHKTITSTAEIQIYYNPECSKAKKALAYARSISSNVNAFDIQKTKGTGTIWHSILSKLNKSPKELLDKSLPYYQANIRGRDFEERDWVYLLMNNPHLVRSPIAVRGNKAIILDNPTDIYKI
ncbi:glutaredoxin [bacterium]|nr:glutaredoxin [bacterium]